jgi:hypothetical protein
LPPSASLILWGQNVGAQRGDEVRFTLLKNGQAIWRSGGPIDTTSPLLFARKAPPKTGWPLGPLEGRIEILRNAQTIAVKTLSVSIDNLK